MPAKSCRSDALHRDHSSSPDIPKRAKVERLANARDTLNLSTDGTRLSNNDIFKYAGVSKRVGYQYLKDRTSRFHGGDTEQCYKRGRGRPTAITSEQRQRIEVYMQTNGCYARSMTMSELRDQFEGLDCSDRTLRRCLNAMGYTYTIAFKQTFIQNGRAERRLKFVNVEFDKYVKKHYVKKEED